MRENPIDPNANDNWHVYVDGGFRTVAHKSLYSSETELKKEWEARNPGAVVVIK